MRLTKERANSGRKHDEFICSDGHHCGVGGYCNNCPHTCTCNDIAADIQEGKPYRKGMLPCQACKNASLSARDGALEEAAQIVEDHYWDSLAHGGIGKTHGAAIAKAIRSLISRPLVEGQQNAVPQEALKKPTSESPVGKPGLNPGLPAGTAPDPAEPAGTEGGLTITEEGMEEPNLGANIETYEADNG